MGYTDAILHIADLPALAVAMAAIDPPVVADGRFNLDTTPAVTNGPAALVYVRMTETEAAQWRGTPGVTILAEAPYDAESTGDRVYEDLFSDEEAVAVYDSVYPRKPVSWVDEEGETQSYTPPERFGVIG